MITIIQLCNFHNQNSSPSSLLFIRLAQRLIRALNRNFFALRLTLLELAILDDILDNIGIQQIAWTYEQNHIGIYFLLCLMTLPSVAARADAEEDLWAKIQPVS